MKWALLSVWDKSGIVELAQALVKNKYSILSSGGTGRTLAEAWCPVHRSIELHGISRNDGWPGQDASP